MKPAISTARSETSAFAPAAKNLFARAIGSILDAVCAGIVKASVLFWMISTGAIVAATCAIVLLRRHPQSKNISPRRHGSTEALSTLDATVRRKRKQKYLDVVHAVSLWN
jgi:hypothetical protein